MADTIRGKTAITGIGETTYYKYGQAPDSEFKMTLQAILAAAEDAGLDPRDLDGFVSYSNDRNDPGHIATALGIRDLKWSQMAWMGGGGNGAGAVACAVAAVAGGLADNVVVFRGLAQGQFGRFGGGGGGGGVATVTGPQAFLRPYGLLSPAHSFAMKAMRYMHEHGVQQSALRAVSLASYYHAQLNPRAVMHGRPLDEESYDNSRWIVEPFHLFDCCQENDGAAAVIVSRAEVAKDLKQKPVYLLGAVQAADYRQSAPSHNQPLYATANHQTASKRLYDMAQMGPEDVDVAQFYENFTGGVVMNIIEHGFCKPEEANDFFTLDNFKYDGGKLPLNTSGGNLAECYMHGLELVNEGVRQLRAQSTAQVPNAEVCLVASAPMTELTSSVMLASDR